MDDVERIGVLIVVARQVYYQLWSPDPDLCPAKAAEGDKSQRAKGPDRLYHL
jgi:hypothetical protein